MQRKRTCDDCCNAPATHPTISSRFVTPMIVQRHQSVDCGNNNSAGERTLWANDRAVILVTLAPNLKSLKRSLIVPLVRFDHIIAWSVEKTESFFFFKKKTIIVFLWIKHKHLLNIGIQASTDKTIWCNLWHVNDKLIISTQWGRNSHIKFKIKSGWLLKKS